MTTAFVLLSHGTRDEAGVAEFLRFRDDVASGLSEHLQSAGTTALGHSNERGSAIVEHAFLELRHPDLPTAAKTCVDRGAQEIILVPLLLFSAGHAKRDIPDLIDAARASGVDVRWTVTDPVGVDDVFVEVAAQRHRQAVREAVDCEVAPSGDGSVGDGTESQHDGVLGVDHRGLLFIGRGGSDPAARRDALEVAAAISARAGVSTWEPAFLAEPGPDLQEGLQRLAARPGVQSVTALPYLWFTGRLVREVPSQLRAVCPPGLSLRVAAHLGNHPKLVARVLQRALDSWHRA